MIKPSKRLQAIMDKDELVARPKKRVTRSPAIKITKKQGGSYGR